MVNPNKKRKIHTKTITGLSQVKQCKTDTQLLNERSVMATVQINFPASSITTKKLCLQPLKQI